MINCKCNNTWCDCESGMCLCSCNCCEDGCKDGVVSICCGGSCGCRVDEEFCGGGVCGYCGVRRCGELWLCGGELCRGMCSRFGVWCGFVILCNDCKLRCSMKVECVGGGEGGGVGDAVAPT